MAIQRDMGRLDSCELGQAIFNNGFLERITSHHTSGDDISDKETSEKILFIMKVFSPDLLRPEGVRFTYAATAGDRWEYFPGSGEIVKHPLEFF